MLDLQSFLEGYEEKFPNDVVHVDREIHVRYEVTALIEKLEKESRYPVLIFHNPITDKGEKSRLPLLDNLYASRKRLAHVIGARPEEAGLVYQQKTKAERRKPVIVSRSEAPCKRVIEKGDTINLFKFPIPVHNSGDPGPYLSSGLLITFDPDSRIDNAGGYHRGWIKERSRIGVLVPKPQHNAFNIEKYWSMGKPAPVAYLDGHHPLITLGLQMRGGYPESHYEAAGGLAGEPLRLVPSETLGDEFLVPADAEVIIEGFMNPGDFGPEGPFGEYPRYLGPQRWSPFMTVTAVTHREDSYWLDIMAGHADHMGAGGFAIEAAVYDAVRKVVPNVKNVHFPLSGVRRFHAYIQLAGKVNDSDPRQAILAALPADFRLKHAFVFDEDVDIYDDREVMWAIATRTEWDKDLVIVPGMQASLLDPSIEEDISCKAGMDCTKPAPPEPFSQVVSIPKDVKERLLLENFIPNDRMVKIPTERM